MQENKALTWVMWVSLSHMNIFKSNENNDKDMPQIREKHILLFSNSDVNSTIVHVKQFHKGLLRSWKSHLGESVSEES